MVSDSIADASIRLASNARDLGRKKRARSAKLKQSKLDVRREQWLSQGAVKNKGCKEELSDAGTRPRETHKEVNRSLENIEMRGRSEEDGGSTNQDSDFSESPANSPSSITSSVLGRNDSRRNFSGSSSSSGGSCSGSMTEEEEGEDDCLDDWEAFADALAADDKLQIPCSESAPMPEPVAEIVPPRETRTGSTLGIEDSKLECEGIQRVSENNRAWKPDDAFRPQSLPNLSKQLSLVNSDRRYGRGVVPWACHTAPTSCPICYEDLDHTDSSFLPCTCGFRLCLFCHKRILEEDGRCPGCRKPYEREPVEVEASVHGGSLTFRLTRSCSMNPR